MLENIRSHINREMKIDIPFQKSFINKSCQEYGCKYRCHDTDNKGSCKTSNRTGTKHIKNDTCKECCYFRVDYGRIGTLITISQSKLYPLSTPKFLPCSFKD